LIILVVIAAAIGGALIPAIRAARINPVEALRE
jgi:ABC-type antimicrobial peptide transport system permease subunit